MPELGDPYEPTTRPQPLRDFWDRPYVQKPEGGKPIPYTRTTTFVSAIEDTYKLGMWQQRHAIRGAVMDDEMVAAIRGTDPIDRDEMDRLVKLARERSGAGDAARLGTYLHGVTEAADRGEDPGGVELPLQSYGVLDPTPFIGHLAAYLAATEQLKAVGIEQFVVMDPLKVAGTTDRIVAYQGKRYIADLKTGRSVTEWGYHKIAAQLAMYARSRPYDFQTHQRLEPHGCELDRGILIHLPAEGEQAGTCTLWWVDLIQGWEIVRLCRDVRATRSVRSGQIFREFNLLPAAPLSLRDRIGLASSRAQVEALWRDHQDEWTPELTELASAHLAQLQPTSEPERTPA
jgi:hypothetical protein